MSDFWRGLFIGMPAGAAVWAMIRVFLRREFGGNWIGF